MKKAKTAKEADTTVMAKQLFPLGSYYLLLALLVAGVPLSIIFSSWAKDANLKSLFHAAFCCLVAVFIVLVLHAIRSRTAGSKPLRISGQGILSGRRLLAWGRFSAYKTAYPIISLKSPSLFGKPHWLEFAVKDKNEFHAASSGIGKHLKKE